MNDNKNNNLNIKNTEVNNNVLIEFIQHLNIFLNKNPNDLNLNLLFEYRKLFFNFAEEILDNWLFYKHELHQLGCKLEYPNKLKHNDACYYIIQHLLDYIQNYNNNLIPVDVKHRLQLICSMQFESPYTNNNLDLGKYLINKSLAEYLKYGNNINKEDKKNISKEFFYVVVFNKLWNSKLNRHTLVYNYIKYNKIFFDLYYSYATIEQRSMSKFKQNNIGGGYFFLLDSKLNPKPNGVNGLSTYEIFRDYRSDVKNKHENYIKDKKNPNIDKQVKFDFIEICKYITIKLLTSLSLQDMNIIITNLAISKPDYVEPRQLIVSKLQDINGYAGLDTVYIQTLLSTMIIIADHEKKELYNDLSRFVFIVSDVRDLINYIKKSSVYADTNPGPIKDRGGHSIIGNILYEFDRNFRYSMYNHYKLYSYYNNSDDFIDLRFDNFGYKNIHSNLGYCKW